VVTDSLELEDPKDPDNCNVFALYSLLAEQKQIAEMRENYTSGGFGYGHAKLALFELILERFKSERAEFTRLMEDPNALEEELQKGAKKARAASAPVRQRIRRSLGFKPA
jgi:tryptophanyl-tRNA synthetase